MVTGESRLLGHGCTWCVAVPGTYDSSCAGHGVVTLQSNGPKKQVSDPFRAISMKRQAFEQIFDVGCIQKEQM
jgi:hypothetical protein